MGKSVKSSGKVSMIRGNDGPTSIFIVGKGKKTVKQRVHKFYIRFEKHGYIGGSFSGPGKREKKQYEKIYHDVYRYYGVSMEDIANKTKRYEDVVRGMISF